MNPVIAAATLIVVLHAVPALALRGVDPGSSCKHAEEVEQQLGSTRRGGASIDETHRTLFFAGRHLGEDAFMAYSCASGTVTRQLIKIQLDHEEQARATFDDLKRGLSADYGAPFKDVDEPTLADRNESASDSELPIERFVVWQLSKRVITLMLSGHEATWELLISGP